MSDGEGTMRGDVELQITRSTMRQELNRARALLDGVALTLLGQKVVQRSTVEMTARASVLVDDVLGLMQREVGEELVEEVVAHVNRNPEDVMLTTPEVAALERQLRPFDRAAAILRGDEDPG